MKKQSTKNKNDSLCKGTTKIEPSKAKKALKAILQVNERENICSKISQSKITEVKKTIKTLANSENPSKKELKVSKSTKAVKPANKEETFPHENLLYKFQLFYDSIKDKSQSGLEKSIETKAHLKQIQDCNASIERENIWLLKEIEQIEKKKVKNQYEKELQKELTRENEALKGTIALLQNELLHLQEKNNEFEQIYEVLSSSGIDLENISHEIHIESKPNLNNFFKPEKPTYGNILDALNEETPKKVRKVNRDLLEIYRRHKTESLC